MQNTTVYNVYVNSTLVFLTTTYHFVFIHINLVANASYHLI